jgi:antitoxin component YwqK of YwqJK toxin-antitoxin module
MVEEMPAGTVYEIARGFLHIEDKELDLSFFDDIPLGPSLLDHSQGLFPEHERKETIAHTKRIQEGLYLSSERDGEERRYRRDGSVISKSFYRKGKLHGPSECFYADETLASRAYFVDDKKEGRANFFDKKGHLLSQLCFRGGLFHGTQRFYFADGKLHCSLPYIQGLFEGQLQLFFPDGTLRREIFMRQGKRHGLDCLWDASGTIFFAFEYENGKLVKTQIKDPVALAYKL